MGHCLNNRKVAEIESNLKQPYAKGEVCESLGKVGWAEDGSDGVAVGRATGDSVPYFIDGADSSPSNWRIDV